MSKVALINPGKNKPWASILPPMNLGSIASYLEKHGVEVYIVDELAGQDVKKSLSHLRPEIVGITATTAMIDDAYRVAKVANDLGAITVMGGVHASFLTDEALKHVNIVVKGEGEAAMLSIVRGNRSRIVKTDYIKNIDEIPAPAWHLMDMGFYLSVRDRLKGTHIDFVPPKAKLGSLMTARGCPFSCIFCCNSWRDIPVRFHSPERVIKDIKFLIEKYKINTLYFAEDDFFMHKRRAVEICHSMQKNEFDLIWTCQARADSIDLDSLKIAKKAGCWHIQFGFESGSQRILDILKKNSATVEQNIQAIRLRKQVDIRVFATFMLGNPTETIEELEATIDFIKNNNIDQAGVLVTTPFPGTELWRWCEDHKLIPKNIDYSKLRTRRSYIPACDTISSKVINKYAGEINAYLNVLTLEGALAEIRNHPFFVLQSIEASSEVIETNDCNWRKVQR